MKSKLMTKLALAASVACAAVGSALANTHLYWTVSGVNAPKRGDSISQNQYSWFIFALADATGTFSNKITTESAINSALASGKNEILNGLSVVSGYNSIGSDGCASFARSSSTFDVSSSGSATFLALFLDALTLENANNYLVARTDSGNGSTQLTKEISATASSTQFDWGAQYEVKWASISTIVVPEPTSGVLLLVGVAALALRRKKAA